MHQSETEAEKGIVSEITLDNMVVKTLTYKEFPELAASNFYIKNALGETVFFRTKQRATAQKAADELYGKGKYSIRVSGF